MTLRHHGQYARHAVPAPLLAPASRAGRDLASCKQSPENVEKRRKALERHLDSFGEFKRGAL
mgnify:FL=1